MEDIAYTGSGRCCRNCWARLFPIGFKDEFKRLSCLAWPMILTQFFQTFIPQVAVIFCGHLGKVEFAAISLANSIINVSGLSVAMGLSSACDTLFSQIFGSENKQSLGICLQRSLIILTLAVLPCWALHLNVEPLLLFIVEDEHVVRLAGQYMMIFMPGLLCFFIYMALSKYVQNQNIVIPNLIIGLIANIVNAILHYVFLFQLNMGTEGSAISQDISYFVMFFLTLLYILVFKVYRETWEGWDRECFQEWGTFMKLAVPGMLMICIEWWSFEVGIFLAGRLPHHNTQLGAQSILFQTEAITFMIPLGFSIAVSIRIGQSLGAGSAVGARTSAWVGLIVVWITSCVVTVLLVTLRDFIPLVFTDKKNTDIIGTAAAALPILAVFMFFDSTVGVIAGILRGCGRQTIGAIVIFIGYYIVGLPIGIPLMFVRKLHFGISGFWIGLAAGLTTSAIFFFIILIKTDWQEQTKRALSLANDKILQSQPPMDDDDDGQSFISSVRSYSSVEDLLERSYQRVRRYSSQYQSLDSISYVPVLELRRIPTRELVLRRGLVLVVLLSILVTGILVRLLVPTYSKAHVLCIPSNYTGYMTNASLPLCPNVTTPSVALF